MNGIIKVTMPHDERGNDAADFIDDPEYKEKMESLINEAEKQRLFPPRRALQISHDELTSAQLTPPCIVKNLYYDDVASESAPGSTGKTTKQLYEFIHIITGRPLYGLEILKRGWCLLVTAEDSRERITARLREIMSAMELTDMERAEVLRGVCTVDVSGQLVKLVANVDNSIVLTGVADQIIEAYKNDPPAMVVFDPLVSFGASEQQVNDNEQALITAGRRIVRGLNCCVKFITHTGKANARDKTLDQYSSRGGSALADGCRMVTVMQTWNEGDKSHRPPSRCTATPDSSITILARPKLSYARPNLPLIWIKRTGFKFEYFIEIQLTQSEEDKATAEQVERFITSELKQGRKHTKNTLETAMESISRNELRKAINSLTVVNRIKVMDLPKQERQGGRKQYLATMTYLAENSEPPGEVQ